MACGAIQWIVVKNKLSGISQTPFAWYMANQLGLKGPELDYLIESSVPVIVYASKQQVPGTILEFNLGKLGDTQYGLLVKYYQTYWEVFRKD